MTDAVLPDNEMLEPEKGLSAIVATKVIHAPVQSLKENGIMEAQVRHNLGERVSRLIRAVCGDSAAVRTRLDS